MVPKTNNGTNVIAHILGFFSDHSMTDHINNPHEIVPTIFKKFLSFILHVSIYLYIPWEYITTKKLTIICGKILATMKIYPNLN